MYSPWMSAHIPPPLFLREASDPVRWRLLATLSRGDLRVRELCDATGEAQNLVSYHLGRLRAAGLVSARRSSADGRDSYYRLDLRRCGELLSSAGAALHPALSQGHRDGPATGPSGRPTRVLFLCSGNSARSQMAEAILRRRAPFGVEVFSAGSHPKPLHQDAIRVMAARGVDIAGQRAKHFSELARVRFDFVVTLCDRVREVCPEFAGAPDATHWSMPDPSVEASSEAFERTAAELESRIDYFIEFIEHAREGQEVA
jgi:ArsR family transcriptional regulator, arsenate/arsenite/antimonite-responsive transcriptional repressor / arsenate reductase (thioredoxin)